MWIIFSEINGFCIRVVRRIHFIYLSIGSSKRCETYSDFFRLTHILLSYTDKVQFLDSHVSSVELAKITVFSFFTSDLFCDFCTWTATFHVLLHFNRNGSFHLIVGVIGKWWCWNESVGWYFVNMFHLPELQSDYTTQVLFNVSRHLYGAVHFFISRVKIKTRINKRKIKTIVFDLVYSKDAFCLTRFCLMNEFMLKLTYISWTIFVRDILF